MDPITSLITLVSTVVSKVWPDKTEQQKELFTLELTKELNETQLLTKQLEVNKAEAENPNLFVSGWRPFVGWICGIAFAWQFVGLPVALFIGTSVGHPINPPIFDISSMLTVLMGMLGLGGMRTYEKIQKVTK